MLTGSIANHTESQEWSCKTKTARNSYHKNKLD